MTGEKHQCKNCNHSYEGYFCSHCGQKRIEERWTLKKLTNQAAAAIFNFEKGYFYTFRKLLTNPGEVVQNFLNGNTVNYSNPFRYTLIGIAINIFFVLSLGIWELQVDATIETYRELGIISSAEKEATMRDQMQFFTKFMNVLPFLMVPFIALVSMLFLRKHKLFYAEHFIMNTFLLGQATLYGILNLILIYFIPDLLSFMPLIGFLIAALVYSQIFHHMFNINYIKGFFLGFLIYIIGFVLFLFLGVAIGIIMAILFAILS